MTGKPTCSCGANEPKRIIFPCAGQANVGELTNLAALQLTEEGYGSIACLALLGIGAENLIANTLSADEVVVLDGCPMLCAKKIAGAQGVAAGQHLVLTEMGIAKGPSKNYTDGDIEKVVSACWKGEGRVKNVVPSDKKSGGEENGCGCGCSGTC
ncbi:putative zinc-binding protein [Methanoregula formicica]|uniref:DGC domain protein n=1 Tax=Methanoregula formicica (strain DSM 22288 / NBRC 105244 / SMSP) TaxID=593750 RepID=L0HIX0_METFS|nr:putative zinc-binding protein [Methanoregula formicica]AGB03711.1 hypothetical protein Metfor_2726 [Methanoregula formicica SMSP]